MMNRPWTVWVLGLSLALALGGCFTEDRVRVRYDELIAAWQAENPTQELSELERTQLEIEAEKQVLAEIRAEREEAAKHGVGLMTNILSGNFPAAIFSLVGLGGIGLGAYRKKKGGK